MAQAVGAHRWRHHGSTTPPALDGLVVVRPRGREPVAHPVLLVLLVVCVAAASSVGTLAMLLSLRVA